MRRVHLIHREVVNSLPFLPRFYLPLPADGNLMALYGVQPLFVIPQLPEYLAYESSLLDRMAGPMTVGDSAICVYCLLAIDITLAPAKHRRLL